MGVKERLAAIEAKLGIEPPKELYGFFWDGPGAPCVGKLTGENNECDGGSTWTHFLAFTNEEIARFRDAGVCLTDTD